MNRYSSSGRATLSAGRSKRSWLAGALGVVMLGLTACAGPAASPAQSGVPVSVATSAPAASAPDTRPTAPAAPATGAAPSPAAATAAPSVAKLNLNAATAEQFQTIPGVGDRMVREFNEYRPYSSIQQFRREIGKYVSADQVAAYEQYVYVPVNPNSADAETLRQLPGVDAAIAAQLVAGRPYASADAFLIKLGQLVPGVQAAAVRTYLATS